MFVAKHENTYPKRPSSITRTFSFEKDAIRWLKSFGLTKWDKNFLDGKELELTR